MGNVSIIFMERNSVMKHFNFLLLCTLLCFAVSLSGCCSIMCGNQQAVTISSDPPGAKVTADNGTTITTPGSIVLRTNETHMLVAEYPGYASQQQKFDKKLNNWIFANILIDFGIFSIPIDFMTGAANELHPKEVHFNFSGFNASSNVWNSGNTQTYQKPPNLKTPGKPAIVKETIEEPPVENLGRFSGQKETCSDCGRTIFRFEQHFTLDKNIVCKECYAKKSPTKITEEIPSSESYNKQTVAARIPTNDNLKVVACENCGRAIGKLEMPYPHKGHVVCYECYLKLKKQP